ncbi:MAG: DUF1015 family protein [Elusimicrobia bacterium]|nr:DUF1015 family protein [Elusimicrobiota bacterium]
MHSLWTLTDTHALAQIQRNLKRIPVLIADGHHRYETSWNYSREFGKESKGAQRMLFYLNPMEDPGLVIFPTHRVLRQNNNLNFDAIAARITQSDGIFSLSSVRAQKPAPPDPDKKECFVLTDGKKQAAVRIKSLSSVKRALESPSQESYKLPLVHLHSLLLPELKKEDFFYTHDLHEAVQRAKKKRTLAILVPPTSTQELYRVVSAGELMPQKSTYFYPKLITGILFRSLE